MSRREWQSGITKIALLFVMCLTVGCPSCGGGSTPPASLTLTVVLTKGAGPNASVLYTGGTPALPSAKTYRMDSFEIFGSSVAVHFLEQGSTDCLSSTVVLGPNLTPSAKVTANPADVDKVFGSMDPLLPVSFTACVDAGGSPPDKLTVLVHYTVQ